MSDTGVRESATAVERGREFWRRTLLAAVPTALPRWTREPMSAGSGELDESTVLRVGIVERHGLVIRLRYRTDVLDAEYATRIAGYHVTALASIAADPDAEHARQSLLSQEEFQRQIDGLA